MENNFDSNVPKIDLPNATVVLVLGIISIVTCCCYGIIGLICGIIALVLAKSATALYVADPGRYTENSYKNMNAGKICAWVGLIMSVLYLIFVIWLIAAIGVAGLTDPNAIYHYFGVQPPV
jgi:hypothetical protein